MAMSRHGRRWDHPAAWNTDDSCRIRFHVLDEFQTILDQLACTDPFQVFRLKLTAVGMVISTVTADSTDTGSALEFASAAIGQENLFTAIRSSVKDAQPV
jgi:hypothetical protein